MNIQNSQQQPNKSTDVVRFKASAILLAIQAVFSFKALIIAFIDKHNPEFYAELFKNQALSVVIGIVVLIVTRGKRKQYPLIIMATAIIGPFLTLFLFSLLEIFCNAMRWP